MSDDKLYKVKLLQQEWINTEILDIDAGSEDEALAKARKYVEKERDIKSAKWDVEILADVPREAESAQPLDASDDNDDNDKSERSSSDERKGAESKGEFVEQRQPNGDTARKDQQIADKHS